MDTPTNAYLRLPLQWEMTPEEAEEFYGGPVISEIVEALPGSPVLEGFRDWVQEHDVPAVEVWGVPDIRAARCLLDMSRKELANAIGFCRDHMALLEEGLISPTVSALLEMSRDLGVPVAVFYRNASPAWHPRTQLGHMVGLPRVQRCE